MTVTATSAIRLLPESARDLLRGSTLVLPTVSTANLPQLVTDVLVQTLGLTRIATLQSDLVLNICGPDPFADASNTSTLFAAPLELYQSHDRRLAVLQQRAPISRGLMADFTRDLVAWIGAMEFAGVLVVASADASYRVDSQIEGTPSFRFLSVIPASTTDAAQALGIKELEQQQQQVANAQKRLHVEGSGILSHLAQQLPELGSSTLKHAMALLAFTLEGDNLLDTVQTAQHVLRMLQASPYSLALEGSALKFPPSWGDVASGALYGERLDHAKASDIFQ
ncbi:hypothetical protein RI367_001875 [Sorochytrium milnesiophthora]